MKFRRREKLESNIQNVYYSVFNLPSLNLVNNIDRSYKIKI